MIRSARIIDRLLDRLSSFFYWLSLRITRFQFARLGFGDETPFFEDGEASDPSYRTVRDAHNAAHDMMSYFSGRHGVQDYAAG